MSIQLVGALVAFGECSTVFGLERLRRSWGKINSSYLFLKGVS